MVGRGRHIGISLCMEALQARCSIGTGYSRGRGTHIGIYHRPHLYIGLPIAIPMHAGTTAYAYR